MALLIGRAAVAAHLGVSIPRLMRLHEREGLPLLRWFMTRPGRGGSRPCWASSPELLTAWLLAKAKTDREDVLARRAAKRAASRAGAEGAR